MILQIEIAGRGRRRLRVARDAVVIGAADDADVTIRHAAMPPRLCRLTRDAYGAWTFEPLIASTAEEVVAPRQLLEPLHPIRVGPITLQRLPDPADLKAKCPICANDFPDRARLCVHCGYDRVRKEPIDPSRPTEHATPPPVEDLPMVMPPEMDAPFRTSAGVAAPPIAESGMSAATWVLALGMIGLASNWIFDSPDEPVKAALGQLLAVIVQGGTLLALLMLAVYFAGLEPGPIHHVCYKCAAIALAIVAIKLWLDDGLTPALLGGAFTGAGRFMFRMDIAISLTVMILPLPLIQLLFRLDRLEWLPIAAAQGFAGVLTFAAMRGLL